MTLGSRSIITSMALLIACTMFICSMGMVSFISWPPLLRRTSADAVRADARAFLHRRPKTMYRAAGGGRGLKSRSFQLLWRNPARQRVVLGKSVSVRVDLGGRR